MFLKPQAMILQNRFVEFMPSEIVEGVLYISLEYKTVIHKCPCGCGNKIITPILPTQWTFFYNGEGVTLHPSVGNWSLKCQSHYWIRNSAVVNIPSKKESKKQSKKKYWFFGKKRNK